MPFDKLFIICADRRKDRLRMPKLSKNNNRDFKADSNFFVPLTVLNGIVTSFTFLLCFYVFFNQDREVIFGANNLLSDNPFCFGLPNISKFLALYLDIELEELHFATTLNFIFVFNSISTYSRGRHFYGNSGWRFFQPFKGGPAFALAQTEAWAALAIAVVMPWLTLRDIGILNLLGFTSPDRIKPGSYDRNFGIFCLLGCLYAKDSEISQFLSILIFDKKAEQRHEELMSIYDKVSSKLSTQEEKKRKLKTFLQTKNKNINSIGIETSKIIYNRTKRAIEFLRRLGVTTLTEINEQRMRLSLITGGKPERNRYVLYLFILYQILSQIYIYIVLAILDEIFIDSATRVIVLYATTHLTVSTSLQTHYMCGRLLHGRVFRVFMIWQGGFWFIVFQFVGWGLISLSCLSQIQNAIVQSTVSTAGLLGIIGICALILSVLVFDTSAVLKAALSDSSVLQRENAKDRFSNEVNEARVVKIFGNDYDYSDEEKFRNDYLRQRSIIVENINKFSGVGDIDRSRNSTVRRNNTTRARTRSPVSSKQTQSDQPSSIDVWEEFEDEEGNVFYYNVTTGKSYKTLPGSIATTID